MKRPCVLPVLLLFLLWQTSAYATLAEGKLPVMRIGVEQLTPLQTGLAVGTQAKQQFPDIESRYDAWLSELFTPARFDIIRQQQLPRLLKHVEPARLNEMQGVAASWQMARESRPGDGQLSLEEYQILNLLPDLGEAPDGIGLGVFGKASLNNQTVVGHNLEWRHSSSLNSLEAISVYTGGKMAFVTIGPAGLVSAAQGFNQYGVFAVLINAEPYSPYSSSQPSLPEGMQLASFSVRSILESASTLPAAGKQLDDRQYTFSHSILLADTTNTEVLEYSPQQGHFSPRYWNSPLHQGRVWGHKQQIAVVDCLMLETMPDTCRDARDSVRWHRLDTLMHFSAQQPASPDDIGTILFDTANQSYELFTEDTSLSLYFLPETNSLYLYAAQAGNKPDNKRLHHAYLDLLPHAQPWKFKLKWFIWPLVLLMLGAVIWVSRRKPATQP